MIGSGGAAGAAGAACHSVALGEHEAALLDSVAPRLHALGVSAVDFAKPAGSGRHYVLRGSRATLFVFSEPDGEAKEIGIVLSSPATDGERDKAARLAAVFAAALSAAPEPEVAASLLSGWRRAGDGRDALLLKFRNNVVAAVTATSDVDGKNLVFKVGEIICDP